MDFRAGKQIGSNLRSRGDDDSSAYSSLNLLERNIQTSLRLSGLQLSPPAVDKVLLLLLCDWDQHNCGRHPDDHRDVESQCPNPRDVLL